MIKFNVGQQVIVHNTNVHTKNRIGRILRIMSLGFSNHLYDKLPVYRVVFDDNKTVDVSENYLISYDPIDILIDATNEKG